ncbi:zinc finger MYM-type protein 2 [Pseudoliparis swirei]|uniref:zinc finger MYM-type protein 2 n=1 Tax=Pseudoliparis swirei TaxID=2059687 RepID=UPI0024BD7BF7|nr:zinc finger MYM-type protein 2 [Pseudoliparis swirei]
MNDDDDVVLVGEEAPPPDLLPSARTEDMSVAVPSPGSPAASSLPPAEPIVIEDEDERPDASASSRIATLAATRRTREGDPVLGDQNGLRIGSTFSLSADAPPGRPTFNPGRGSGPPGQLVHNGDSGTHNRPDSWISQSASAPRNQKQTGVDPPASSSPRGPGQTSSAQPRTVKVTCANCKKPLKKGQTAYQRKGSTHLFCSTPCLSAFSHKPAPKKTCTMCKKDITTMKGTIVAQVDSSESFQEFCSTGCLGAYENKQNPPKSGLKTKCTVCGKLTEIRHEVSFKAVTHKICSDSCFNVYRRANGLIMNCCEQCGDYLPSRASANHFLLVDGQQKRFCCQACITEYKQAHSKLATCLTCKTLIKTGEVLHSLGAGGSTMGSYCAVSCMNKGKLASTSFINSEPSCHSCKRNSLPQYQATLPEGDILNFCSSPCVAKFQNAGLQATANGQPARVQLKCNYCRGAFSLKPETLEWEDKVFQFCSRTCCEDYKKLHCIVTFCEYCQEEKTLHETLRFSGVKRPFCSEGCKLLFKQDFIRRLGLKCVSCNHCSQLCRRGLSRQLGGVTRDFCSEGCALQFNDWYYKALRCDCCKVQGSLTESVMWRTEMKHFCDQECLLKFYLQQSEPIMVTQKGPENCTLGYELQGPRLGLVSQGTAACAGGGAVRDVKNKAVLCKPLTLTKATYCKPHMQSKLLQTDVDDGVKREYVPVPIPVPVFIPVPMSMYAQITPALLPLPLPIPVPVFLPTSLQGAEQILQTIKELKDQLPSGPAPLTEDQHTDVKLVPVKMECRVEVSSCSSEKEEEQAAEEEEMQAAEEEEKQAAEEEEKQAAEEEEKQATEEEEKQAAKEEEMQAAEEEEKQAAEEEETQAAEEEEKQAAEEEEKQAAEEEEKQAAEEEEKQAAEEEEKQAAEEEEKQAAKEEEMQAEEEKQAAEEEEKQAAEEEEKHAAEEEKHTAEEEEKQAAEEEEKQAAKEEEKQAAEEETPEKKEKKEQGEEEEEEMPKEEEEDEEEEYEPELDLEADFPQASDPVPEGMDQDLDLSHPPVLDKESAPRPQPRRQGHKRRALEEGSDQATPTSSRRSLPLKARYGVNAWKRWALSSPDQSEDTRVKDGPTPARSNSNLLALSPEELSAALSRFVREACRPGGERYSPDSMLYLCLGIQQHLQARGRADDVFSDPSYRRFGEQLNAVLRDWRPRVLSDGSPCGRVEECSLWSSRQLGGQSPAALLRSLVYLNTKYLGLRTVEQHLHLSFSSVYGLRLPPVAQDPRVQTASRKRKLRPLEDGGSGGVRCPVKKHECQLYDLYRSKCPPSLRQRLDVFYVQPDPACGPGDPLSFSSTPLERPVLESLLTRVLLVRDLYPDQGGGEEDEEEEERPL